MRAEARGLNQRGTEMTIMQIRHAAMLDRISGAAKLETQLTGSGGRAEGVLNDCLRAGWAKRCDHPTVTDRRDGYPADAIAITLDGMRELEVFRARLASAIILASPSTHR